MRKLPLIAALILLAFIYRIPQNPHGGNLRFSCTLCHTTEGWFYSAATAQFNHDSTGYRLEGQHVYTGCKACHTSLVFQDAGSDCIDCHTDMHKNTVSPHCSECHNQNSWIISNTAEIHYKVGFPLLGVHNYAGCASCHSSVSLLEFPPLGTDCFDCHRADYQAAANPDHTEAGFSTHCTECHNPEAYEWSMSGYNHNFFPLTKGHQINNCAACHGAGLFEPVSNECIDCHRQDFLAAVNPVHEGNGFTATCTECHTTDPGWTPAEYKAHDGAYFPIYSGKHGGEWENCTACHQESGNFTVFSCTGCHEHSRGNMDEEHRDISGYSYSSSACFSCHPTGREEESFNHNATGFPLAGAHNTVECTACHSGGFKGTSMDCSSCHRTDFDESANPDHQVLGFSESCEECHTTDIGWEPAAFPNHHDFYALNGAHAAIAGNCVSCHNGNYQDTPDSCFGCHEAEYNNTGNPSHSAVQFPSECEICHSVTAWTPADFQHDALYFPIYAGKHSGAWDGCNDCHNQPSDYSVFSCIICHEHNQAETDNRHREVNGYVYISNNCLACHPNGTGDD